MKVIFTILTLLGILGLSAFLLAPISAPAAAELQPVIILLKAQPQAEIAAQVWAEKQALLEAASAELRQAHPVSEWRRRNPAPLSRAQENDLARRFIPQALDEAQLALLKEKALRIEELRASARQEIYRRSLPVLQKSQAPLVQQIEAWGGEVVYQYTLWNAVAARLPAERLSELAALSAVAEVFEDGVLQPLLDVSVPTSGAPAFWSAGYTGQGVDVAVVDTGIDASHPALSGKVLAQKRCLDKLGTAYNSIDPSPDDVNGHGTHIAGIIGSQNSPYRGVAYGIRGLINAKAGGDDDGLYGGGASMADSDAMKCVEWAIIGNPYGAEVLNFSFGGGTAADDTPLARFWDAVVSQMNVVATIAAGNSGPNPQTLLSPGIAPNVISVANVQDYGTLYRVDDSIRNSSSRGPTAGGRKKPDLAAPGTSIVSTSSNWEGANADWVSLSGTSMAAPHVAGAAALLISAGVSDPLAVKALLINTAEDKGDPGWDSAYGWGYIDLNNAVFHLEDVYVNSVAETPDVRFYAGPALSGDTATLVWNRRVPYAGATTPPTAYTLSDLNLFAYREADNAPIGSSTSALDNVEQVKFSAAESKAVLAVRVNGDIVGAATEKFALAVPEGFTPHVGPHLTVLATLQGDLQGQAGEVITVTLMVKNSGDLKAFNNTLTLTPSANLSLLSSVPLTETLPDLAAGEVYPLSLSWSFQKQDETEAGLYFSTHSYSYETDFTSVGFIPYHNYYFPLIFR
ncbi:MAG: peptidase S8 and S53, subtilisin, kexin, sedolisin [Anaerolineae bacterium]|jgi:subtilisin family serine protease|nr:MAG: peptidase S8 and S53, subtilisin, kexin, sedolisin [Anaerolineae bacterium]